MTDVNFEIGINLERNFRLPLRHISVIPSTIWASRDVQSTDLTNSCLSSYNFLDMHFIMHTLWFAYRILNKESKKDFSLSFEILMSSF